ncbi:hypothetical protein D3C78_1307600 [compost metagenome]
MRRSIADDGLNVAERRPSEASQSHVGLAVVEVAKDGHVLAIHLFRRTLMAFIDQNQVRMELAKLETLLGRKAQFLLGVRREPIAIQRPRQCPFGPVDHRVVSGLAATTAGAKHGVLQADRPCGVTVLGAEFTLPLDDQYKDGSRLIARQSSITNGLCKLGDHDGLAA